MRENFNPTAKKMLGEILVERNTISKEHLQLALSRQNQQKGEHKYIGEILFGMGIPQEKINEAMDAYDKRKSIGKIFLDLRVITIEKLRKALVEQTEIAKRGIRKPLGKLLLEMEYINYHQYMNALSKHFNMSIISLNGFYPSCNLQKVVGEAYAQKHQIMVLENSATKIRLALSEPSAFLMDELRRIFPSRKRVEFYLAYHHAMDYCLKGKSDPIFPRAYA